MSFFLACYILPSSFLFKSVSWKISTVSDTMRDPNGVYGIWDYIPKDSRHRSEKFLNFIKPPISLTEEDQKKDKLSFDSRSIANTKPKEVEQSWLQSTRRFTGHFKFSKKGSVTSSCELITPPNPETSGNEGHKGDDDDVPEVTCGRQLQQYCASTSLHGYRYISEPKRAFAERSVFYESNKTTLIYVLHLEVF